MTYTGNYTDENPRKLLNILKICEDYQTNGINYAWMGRKSTTQAEKEVLTIHVDYPDVDWCIRTKTYISYDENEKLLYICDALKYGKNHWINTLIDDVKNSRVDIKKYYIGAN